MEKSDSVTQKRQEVLKFLADHARIFCRQGSVQSSWRQYQGRKLGPFFRLAFRRAGKLSSYYLGSDAALVEEVRRTLQDMQAPLRQRQERDQELAMARAAFNEQKREFDQELRRMGLFLKGNQIRGWRTLRSRPRVELGRGKLEVDHEG